ncbi:hypothetical protein DMI74_09570 [Akkermansia muciniphila]|nr:hypothetical protein DMI74_09570 [Akkermansia muciniphila]
MQYNIHLPYYNETFLYGYGFGIRKQLKILRVSILCYNSLKIMIFNISGPFVKMTGQSLLFIGFMIDLASFSLLDGFQIRFQGM